MKVLCQSLEISSVEPNLEINTYHTFSTQDIFRRKKKLHKIMYLKLVAYARLFS